MTGTYTLYAICTSGRRHYLQSLLQGTRRECETLVKRRVKQGLPTHFLVISKLDLRDATLRYCDGTWDELSCSYLD